MTGEIIDGVNDLSLIREKTSLARRERKKSRKSRKTTEQQSSEETKTSEN